MTETKKDKEAPGEEEAVVISEPMVNYFSGYEEGKNAALTNIGYIMELVEGEDYDSALQYLQDSFPNPQHQETLIKIFNLEDTHQKTQE